MADELYNRRIKQFILVILCHFGTSIKTSITLCPKHRGTNEKCVADSLSALNFLHVYFKLNKANQCDTFGHKVVTGKIKKKKIYNSNADRRKN